MLARRLPSLRRLLPGLAAVACVIQPAVAQSILRDAETEALFRDMANPLVAAAGLDPKNVDIVLVGDASINAFVAGGQAVYINSGLIDILFSNEAEIQALAEVHDFEKAVAAIAAKVPVLVSTRSEKGAIAIAEGMRYEVYAAAVEEVIDTTGAGDLFAAGFLAAYVEGENITQCLKLGAVCAAEIISHYGARPEADMKALRAHSGL